VQGEVQQVTGETRQAAIDLLVRFFREEGFTTPASRIMENLDRMLVDPSCWCALAVAGSTPQAVVTVSTVLYVEWGRFGEIGDLYVLPEHRVHGHRDQLEPRSADHVLADGHPGVRLELHEIGRAHV